MLPLAVTLVWDPPPPATAKRRFLFASCIQSSSPLPPRSSTSLLPPVHPATHLSACALANPSSSSPLRASRTSGHLLQLLHHPTTIIGIILLGCQPMALTARSLQKLENQYRQRLQASQNSLDQFVVEQQQLWGSPNAYVQKEHHLAECTCLIPHRLLLAHRNMKIHLTQSENTIISKPTSSRTMILFLS